MQTFLQIGLIAIGIAWIPVQGSVWADDATRPGHIARQKLMQALTKSHDFEGETLEAALTWICNETGLFFFLDSDAFDREQRAKLKQMPVHGKAEKGATAAQCLTALLASIQLSYRIEEDLGVVIMPRGHRK